MKPLTIPTGTAIMLGRPANPMPQTLSEAIGVMVRAISGISEAYLPQCFVKAVVEPPAQVLVVVLDHRADRQSVLDAVGEGLNRVLPQGMHLDVLPMSTSDALLSTVRGTRMHIHCAPPEEKRPWWRFWLERYCCRILEEVAAASQGTQGTAHDRYLKVYKLIRERDKQMANCLQ